MSLPTHWCIAVSLLGALLTAAPARANQPAPWYESVDALGPGGTLTEGQHALFLMADTELAGYPAVFVGWRVGIGELGDFGIEAGGIDVAGLGRLHLKLRLLEPEDHAYFVGLRFRLEIKRHKQDFGGGFRPIDDLGLVFSPELTAGFRFGENRRHILHLAASWYFDIDVRVGYGYEHFVMPLRIGYEYREPSGFHVIFDAGVFFEVFEPRTAGEPIPALRLIGGYRFSG